MRCYRKPVPTAAAPSRTPRGIILLALILANAACAHPDGRASEAAATVAAQDAVAPRGWWHGSDDPLLSRLIGRGLDALSDRDCDIAALRERAASKGTLGARLKRLFEPAVVKRDKERRGALLSRAARRRAAAAERIALAYLEVRRLEDIRALRAGLLAQYADNAEIAEFRRQAGLVPAIDGAITATQDETARAELGRTEGRMRDALVLLAELTDEGPAVLAGQMVEASTRPYPLAAAKAEDSSGTAAGQAPKPGHAVALTDALKVARRAVADARLAYREGAGSLATLYVAEAAALSVETALIDARADAAAEEIRQASARSRLWAAGDVERMALAPEPVPAPEPAEDDSACD